MLRIVTIQVYPGSWGGTVYEVRTIWLSTFSSTHTRPSTTVHFVLLTPTSFLTLLQSSTHRLGVLSFNTVNLNLSQPYIIYVKILVLPRSGMLYGFNHQAISPQPWKHALRTREKTPIFQPLALISGQGFYHMTMSLSVTSSTIQSSQMNFDTTCLAVNLGHKVHTTVASSCLGDMILFPACMRNLWFYQKTRSLDIIDWNHTVTQISRHLTTVPIVPLIWVLDRLFVGPLDWSHSSQVRSMKTPLICI